MTLTRYACHATRQQLEAWRTLMTPPSPPTYDSETHKDRNAKEEGQK